jgi:CHAT domain-containing protein/tetratricopeptide (TPR) repeat protein
MSHEQARSEVERLLALGADDRELASSAPALSEPALLELIDEVRDLVMSDLDRALAMGGVLRMIADRSGASVPRARARSAWAHALNYANRFEEAIVALDEASAIAEECGDALESARAMLAKAQSLARLGRLEEAGSACVRAGEIFSRENQPALTLRAVTNHAIILRMLGRWDESVPLFDRALELASGDPPLRAQIQSNRAESLLELGRFQEAERAFRDSCELLERVGMERVAAIVRGNLADMLGRQGRLSEAIEQFELARRFFERDRAAGDLARIEAELADVLAETGLTGEAAELYARSCEALAGAGLVAERARALTGLGALLLDEDPSRARVALDGARDAWRSLDNEWWLRRISLLEAQLALRQGDIDAAQRGADLSDEPAHDPHMNRIIRRTIAAEIQQARGNADGARRMLEEAVGIAEELGIPPVLAGLHHRMGRLLAHAGRPDDAIASFERAIQEVERIRGALQGDRFRAAFMGDHSEIYHDAADLILDTRAGDAITRAFDISEQARARAMQDMIRGGVEIVGQLSSSPSQSDSSLLERLGQERARVNYLFSRLDPTGEGGSSRPVSAWLEDLRETEARVTELETRLASSNEARTVLATPTPVSELIGSIPEGRVTLVFVRRNEGLGCYCLRRGEVRFHDLGVSAEECTELASAVGFQLRRAVVRGSVSSGRSGRRMASAVHALQGLYDAILRPIEAELARADRICVVPFGVLHTIPFGSLHDGERFMIERFPIVRLPSASLARTPEHAGAPETGHALVVGVADRFAPEIGAEARAVSGAIEGSILLLDEHARADPVFEAMSHANVIHIASHGVFPPGNPLSAALKMFDRWVTAREIFALRLNGSVVVLSGCETGRSETDRGDETYGFLRAFLAAGAGGVVSSLWAAHDGASRTLMTDMYTLAPEHGTPAERIFLGLRSAQLRAIERSLHPGLWSGFTAAGVG